MAGSGRRCKHFTRHQLDPGVTYQIRTDNPCHPPLFVCEVRLTRHQGHPKGPTRGGVQSTLTKSVKAGLLQTWTRGTTTGPHPPRIL